MSSIVKMFLIVLSIVLFIAAILGAAYVFFYQGWVLGIVCIAEACKATPVDSWGIAWGVVRILLSSLASTITFYIIWAIGMITANAAESIK